MLYFILVIIFDYIIILGKYILYCNFSFIQYMFTVSCLKLELYLRSRYRIGDKNSENDDDIAF